MRVYTDISYKKTGYSYHHLDLYLPDGECSAVVLYFHGGGFIEGSRTDYPKDHPFIRDMVDAGLGVACSDYILYPDARFPDFIEDGAAAVKFIKENISEYTECKKLIICGTSAGGYMSQMLCFDKKYLEAVGVTPDSIDAYIHDAGQTTVHFNVLRERGFDHRRIMVNDAAPIYHVGLAKSYPPMQLIISDNDIQNRPEQTDLLVGTLRHFGYDMSRVHLTKTHGKHVWYVDATDENGKSEFAKLILPFIKTVI